MPTRVPVLIIGAGIAGLACSAELRKRGVGHTIVAKDIGGRVVVSDDGRTNYGAYICGADNRHILPLVTRGRRLRLHRVQFHGEGPSSFWSAWRRPGALWRFYRAVAWFQRRYHQFQRRAEIIGQYSALKEDADLDAMYTQSAGTWLQERGLRTFASSYIDPIVRMCTFSEVSNLSAFDFFHVAMYLTIPVHEFSMGLECLAARSAPVVIDEVTNITIGPPHTITTQTQGTFIADAIVLATPIESTRRWLTLPYDKSPRGAWMYHLRGRVKRGYSSADLNVFRQPENDLFLSRQPDATFLCYRLKHDDDFSELFDGSVEIIATRHWDPGFWLGGTSLLDVTVGPQVFLAGDHSVVGMEDAYISGIAAARAVSKARQA